MIVGLLISSLIFIVGCRKSEQPANKEMPMGRYIEQNVEAGNCNIVAGEVIGILKTKDNKLQICELNEGLHIFEQGEDNNWFEVKDKWINEFNKLDFLQILCVTNDEEGNIYFACQQYDRSKKMGYTYIVKGGGEHLEEVNIPWHKTAGHRSPSSISILKNGDMMIIDKLAGIERYSLAKQSFVRSYEGKPSEAIVAYDKLYAINNSESTIEVYDVDNGELVRSIPCDWIEPNAKLAVGEEQDIYLIGSSGIKHLTDGGSVWELLVDGSITFFNMPSYTLAYVKAIDKEIYTLFKRADAFTTLKKYSYSKDMPAVASTELTVYTLKKSDTLNQIVTLFQGSHPDIKVTVQVGLERGSSLTEEEVVKALNTELLAGKGPDLILLDGLNSGTYIGKGMLADMKSCITDSEEGKACLENIVQAYETNDKIFAVPIRFTLPMLWGSKELIDKVKSIEDLAAYQKEHPDEKVLTNKAADELINRFYISCRPSWFDSQGKLQEEQMKKYLESIKVLANQGQTPSFMKMQTSRKFNMLGVDINEMVYLAYGFTKIQFGEPAGIDNLLEGATANEQRGDGSLGPLTCQSIQVFEPMTILSINASSKKQEIAKDFIEMALSEEIQDMDMQNGFPVNKVSFEKWIQGKNYNKEGIFRCHGTGQEINGKEYVLYVGWGYEDELAKYYEYSKTAKVPVVIDQKLIQIILDESAGYFDGEITVEEAVKNIKQKAEFYLAE